MSSRKNRILFLLQLPPPIHGVSVINKNVIESELISNEFDVKIISLKFVTSFSKLGKASPMKLLRMLIIGFQVIGGCFFFRPKAVYFTLTTTGYSFYRDVLYVAILKLFKIKRIYHLHGKGIKYKEYLNGKKLINLLYRFVFKDSYVISLSELLSEDINLFHPRKIFIVNNGIETMDNSLKMEVEQNLQLLFLSNLIIEKGIFDFLKALKCLKDKEECFYATIIGKSYNVSEKELADYIVANNLPNVNYVGPKYGNEKYEYFKKATILVFPTTNDAFPLVILEAMQFGIPVISTFEGGIPDIIDNGINGFLVPKNTPEAIAEKIRFLLNNPLQRIKMGENAKNKFNDKFTLARFESNMLSVFHEVIKEN